MIARQLHLGFHIDSDSPPSSGAAAEIEKLSSTKGTQLRGAIFTRPEVVNFILDLAGYTVDQPLYKLRLLEPAFGGGDFLLPIINRLLVTWRKKTGIRNPLEDLQNSIRAVELHHETFRSTYTAIVDLLQKEKLTYQTATTLANSWLIQGDFLILQRKVRQRGIE